jgi:uncharacterized protein YukE
MAGQIVVDVSHLKRLSSQFREAATELGARAERFRSDCGGLGEAYGTLAASHSAARQHEAATQQTLDHLARMREDLAATADRIDAQARDFQRMEDANAIAAMRVRPSGMTA